VATAAVGQHAHDDKEGAGAGVVGVRVHFTQARSPCAPHSAPASANSSQPRLAHKVCVPLDARAHEQCRSASARRRSRDARQLLAAAVAAQLAHASEEGGDARALNDVARGYVVGVAGGAALDETDGADGEAGIG
jgi:hypothetical protein